ncbi:MAG: phosphoglucosamine mutase [Acidimicrobiia bacterium]
MTLRFGTDGVRGIANRDLTPEVVVAFGRAAARVLGTERPFLIGRDTRQSGTMIESALAAGLCAQGASAQSAGVLPTPGLAFLAEVLDAPAAMISASHNPFPDNGIKLFAAGGRKVADEIEAQLEAELAAVLEVGPGTSPEGAGIGTATRVAGSVDRYVVHLIQALEGRRLDGLRVVLDCGHGAAYGAAPRAARELGLDLTVLNATPDGSNINRDCGSTHPGELQRAVVELGADAGLAFDGDADRVIAVDERGRIVDGDHILLIGAIDLHQRRKLSHDTIAATVMSNLGLRRALAEHAIGLVETPVGDRNVLAAIEGHDLVLGGEQSGHVIYSELATTGDGTLTGLLLLDTMVRRGRTLSELAAGMTTFPQVLRNVTVSDPTAVERAPDFWARVEAAERALGGDGRVLVRRSGTEPVVRVMVEATTLEQAEQVAGALAANVPGAAPD